MSEHYDNPVARNTDPTTSHAAAEKAGRGSDILRARVARVMESHGDWMTHEEIFQLYSRTAPINGWPFPASESGVRTRVRELFEEGAVQRDEKATVKNANGNRVHQWRYVADPQERAFLAADRQDDRDSEREGDYTVNPDAPSPNTNPHQCVETFIHGPSLGLGNYHVLTTPTQIDRLPIGSVLMTIGPFPDVLRQDYLGQWRSLDSGTFVGSDDILEDARLLYVPREALDLDLEQFIGGINLEPQGDQ